MTDDIAMYGLGALPDAPDQYATPMCVACSSSGMKAWQDRRDQGRFFDFDEPTFFGQIGGTPAGAYVRNAMERMTPCRTRAGWSSSTRSGELPGSPTEGRGDQHDRLKGIVVMARPDGFERAPPTIVIEGVAELVEALRAA